MLLSPSLELSLHKSFHTVPCRKHRKVQTVRLSLIQTGFRRSSAYSDHCSQQPREKSSLVSRVPTSGGEQKTRAAWYILMVSFLGFGERRKQRLLHSVLSWRGNLCNSQTAKDDKLPRASCSWECPPSPIILKCFPCKVFDRACSHRIEGMKVNEEIIYSPITMVFYDTSTISTTQQYLFSSHFSIWYMLQGRLPAAMEQIQLQSWPSWKFWKQQNSKCR